MPSSHLDPTFSSWPTTLTGTPQTRSSPPDNLPCLRLLFSLLLYGFPHSAAAYSHTVCVKPWAVALYASTHLPMLFVFKGINCKLCVFCFQHLSFEGFLVLCFFIVFSHLVVLKGGIFFFDLLQLSWLLGSSLYFLSQLSWSSLLLNVQQKKSSGLHSGTPAFF